MKLKHFILSLLALLANINAFAYDAEINGIFYNFSGNEAIVTYYDTENNSYYDDISIPNSIRYSGRTYNVTSIGDQAFCNCSGLTSISIPNSVTNIGDYVFSGCSGLTSVSIPNSVTSIGDYVFSRCSNLTSVTIGSSVANIGKCIFSFCNNLAHISVDAENTTYDSRGNCNAIIETATNTLIAGCMSTVIPNDVTSIGPSAFENCSGLTSIDIPNTVRRIDRFAFYGCTDLISVFIPSSVTFIDTCAFAYCIALNSVSIPESVETIGSEAFSCCCSLTSVRLSDGLLDIGRLAFGGCVCLTSLTIPSSVRSIGEEAFCPIFYHSETNYSSLTHITVDEGNTYYDSRNSCNAIIEKSTNKLILGCSNTLIPSTVTSIGNSAFSGSCNLTSIIIPESVNSVGSNAFYRCGNLTSVESNIQVPFEFGTRAFDNISPTCILTVPSGTRDAYIDAGWTEDLFKGGIVEKVVPSPTISFADAKVKALCVANWDTNHDGELSEAEAAAVPNLGEVFRNSDISSFNELQYFTGLTSIGAYAFCDCYNLSSIIIPEGIISIGNYAFANNPISDVQIPASVQSIGENAFGGSWDDCPDNDESYCWVYYPNTYTVSEDNQYYSSHRGILYNKDKTRLIDCPVGYCQDIYFPSTLKEILSNAFSGNGYLDGRNLYIYDLTKFCQINIIGTPYLGGSVFSKVNKVYIYTTHYWSDGGSYQQYDEHTTSLYIPSDVKTIGKGTFFGWKKLTNVTFPTMGVEEIGDYAFACTKINNVTLPATVQTIGQNAFYQQWDEYVYDEDGDWCGTNTWTMAMDSLTIPQSVQGIASNAFNLTNDARVTSKSKTPNNIASNAFKNASNCTLTVPEGTQSTYSQKTGWNTFRTIAEDENLCPYMDGEVFTATTAEGIEMTFKVLSAASKTAQVGDGSNPAIDQSFDGDLVVPSQINGLSVTDIGCKAFYYCENLQSVTIQEGIVRLGQSGRERNMTTGPFCRAKIAQSITLPSTVSFIGMFTFAYSEIGEITLPPTVTYLEMCAFYHANIGYLDIPYSDTEISYGRERVPGDNWTAFGGTKIGILTFNRKFKYSFPDSYSSVIAPFSYTTIGELRVGPNGNIHSDLCDCTVTDYYPRVEEELVEGSFYYTQYSVYAGRSRCTNLHLPEGYITITSVPYGTQNISIPSTVTTIAEDAFSEAYISSVTVYIREPLTIGAGTFNSDTYTDRRSNATLYVPAGCKAAYEAADYWKDFKEIIELEISKGDLDGNGTVSITDIVMIIDVMADPITHADKLAAADVNNDGNVTITDCVAAIDLIAAQASAPSSARRKANTMFSDTDFITAAMQENVLNISLENERRYTAFQMTVSVPESMTLGRATMDKMRGADHLVTVRDLGRGQYLVAGFSADNEELMASSGRLLSIITEGQADADIVISDIEFATTQAEAYYLADVAVSGTPTGINEMKNEELRVKNEIYDLQGRRITKPQKGIYIYNGKKTIIK